MQSSVEKLWRWSSPVRKSATGSLTVVFICVSILVILAPCQCDPLMGLNLCPASWRRVCQDLLPGPRTNMQQHLWKDTPMLPQLVMRSLLVTVVLRLSIPLSPVAPTLLPAPIPAHIPSTGVPKVYLPHARRRCVWKDMR